MIPPDQRLRRAIHMNDALLVRRIIKSNPRLLHNPDTSPAGLSNSNLHLAASFGHDDVCKVLLHEGHEDPYPALNEQHQTALMLAAEKGHIAAVHLLCDNDPSCVTRKDIRGRNAVMYAAMGQEDSDDKFDTAIQLLLTYAPDGPADAVNHADYQGNTPLHFAISKGNMKIVRTLVAAGADVDQKNMFNWAPASYSATRKAELALKELLADLGRRDRARMKAQAEKTGGGVRIVSDEGTSEGI